MSLTVGSLFSGIGGLDLGLERAGMNVIWQSEIEPYACKVLKKHWPEVVNHGDIKEIKWGNIVPPDIICGGYPCQPFSTAGLRKGEDDPRHLWPWVRQAISELRPRYAILENVRGHLSMGGMSVVGELATLGYDAEWRIVSAASVGANHRRDRIIIVAYPQEQHSDVQPDYFGHRSRPEKVSQPGNSSWTQDVAYPDFQPRYIQRTRTVFQPNTERCSWWETEPDVGRMADGIPNRLDRLRGLGNAVVPQVAEAIGRLVMEHAS